MISAQASQTLEEIAAEAGAPLWFQLYARPTIEATLSLVRRAEDAGFRRVSVTNLSGGIAAIHHGWAI